MKKVSEVFCTCCGRRSDANRVAFLGKVKLGDSLCSVKLNPHGIHRKPDVYVGNQKLPAGSVKLIHMKRKNGVIEQIGVRIRYGRKQNRIIMGAENRICPYCEEAGFHPLAGYYPSFYLGLLGPSSVGKTTFCHSTVSRHGQAALNELLSVYDAQVVGKEKYADRRRETATPPETLRLLDGFVIRSGKREMAVIPVDTAGETFLRSETAAPTEFQAEHSDLVCGICDALAVFHDERNLAGTQTDTVSDDQVNRTSDILQNNEKKTVFAIYTKSDKLALRCRSDDFPADIGEGRIAADSRLFKQVHADESREKLESEVAKHMARANWFFRKYIESPMEITSGTPCFCISSGTMADDENAIDSRGACNLALPILWLYLRWAA